MPVSFLGALSLNLHGKCLYVLSRCPKCKCLYLHGKYLYIVLVSNMLSYIYMAKQVFYM